MISPSFQYSTLARSPLAGRVTLSVRGRSQKSRSSAWASNRSGGGAISVADDEAAACVEMSGTDRAPAAASPR